jgi:hypothetical protein
VSGIHQILLGSGGTTLIPLPEFVTTTGAVVSGGTSAAFYWLGSGLISGGLVGMYYQRSLFGSLDSPVYWLINGVTSDYEAKGTWNPISGSGSISGSTIFTNLSTNRLWTLTTTGSDAVYDLFIEIRRVGSVDILTSSTVTFETFGSP